MPTAYYNEIDPYAAQWLRNLIDAGHIAPGVVDERSILDVRPDDLRGFTQCHFFAGIGVWSYALRRAGWPDDRPVWTGSCPCQPFSVAGVGGGFDDERHLWPFWHYLIEQCRPAELFGEQVASRDGLAWLDLVLTDLEATGYACGAVDLCAAGVGAPHIRQRQWLFARRLAHPQHAGERPDSWAGRRCFPLKTRHNVGGCGFSGGVADTEHDGHGGQKADAAKSRGYRADNRIPDRGASGLRGATAGPTNGHWANADWLLCRDGSWRPVEPGTFPLAHGAASRVGRLRAYGNAIVAQAAEQVIRAYMECTQK